MLLILSLWACQGDQTFSQQDADVEDVQGAGVLTYSPLELLWTDLEEGNTVGQTLTIESVGELNLLLYEARIIQSANGQFYMEETEDKTLGPGTSLEIPVVCSITRDQPIDGVLQVKTNDIDHISFEIPLRAIPLGWVEDTGDSTTDSGDSTTDSGDSTTDSGDATTDSGTEG